MSSANSPCAACKVRRCKCTQECVFAPYFPPDQPQKFATVHNVFGASNVAKLLTELDARHREDAVNSLAYEAEFRLRDPVYGCVGLISILQHRLKQMQNDLCNAKKELAGYIGPQAILPFMAQQQQHPGNPSSSSLMPYNIFPLMGIPTGPSGPHLVHQQQLFEAQQMAAREHQEIFRAFEQKPQQTEHGHTGYDAASVAAIGFNQMNISSGLAPSLALGSFDNVYHLQPEVSENPHSHHNHQIQAQLLFQPEHPQLQQPIQAQQQNTNGEDDRIMDPNC